MEIRDPTDAVVQQQTLTTDGHGALSGSVQLAAEPTLGDWHLNVVMDDKHRVYSTFSVQAYRKPEMTVTVKFDREHYLGGSPVPAVIDAQYFFGRPVTGAQVRYNVSYFQTGGSGSVEQNYDAVGITDGQGQLHLNLPTKRLPADRFLTVQATVTDLSRRRAQGAGNTTVTGGMYKLTLTSDKSVYHPGERIVMTASATDYDGKPVAGAKARIQMVEHKEDNQHRAYDETTTRDVVTGSDGSASADFSTPREASLDFHAESFDAQQDKIVADAQVEVTADKDELAQAQPTPPILALSADKNEYRPGDTAQLTIDTLLTHRPAMAAEKMGGGIPARPARTQAWALVTLEGESLGEARVVRLTGRKTTIPIPLAVRDFPSITVNVAIIQDRQIYEQQQSLPVSMPGKELAVSITPDKEKYQPGDTATYTVTTKDSNGTGVPADVSLGVIDASIYDIQADNTEDMKDVFYNGQAVRLTSSYSFAAEYSGGGYQVIASANAAMPAPMVMAGAASFESKAEVPAVRVRSELADTAYWNAGVETGSDGTAQVGFTMPDNLTKWRATARAITLDTKIGSATNDVTSVMPLLVRLELPRFTVQGDRTVVSAIVQNGTADARTVQVSLQAQGATSDASAPMQQTINLPASGQQRLDWPVTIGSTQQASFTVTANGGAGGQDAAQGILPVVPNGVKTVTASAFTLSGADTEQSIDLTALPPGASLTLMLSPSLAAGVTDAVHDLAENPQGDAEESADALVADAAAARALHDAGKSSIIGKNQDLDTYVSTALQKLYRYQHPDGGWNWWEFDQTDGDMTASILGALAETDASGLAVDHERLLRGADALRRLLKDDEDLDSRADWLLALSMVAPDDARAGMLALYGERDKLGTYSRASLALGLAHLASSEAVPTDAAAQDARTVAGELSAAATVEGRSASWPLQPGDDGCFWAGDDITMTAHVLRALLTVSPSDEHIPGAVRWLMANRDGKSWDSAHASAEAVLALSQYIEQTGELAPNYTAQALLDGATIGTLSATPQQTDSPLTIALTPDQLSGHRTLTIQRQGAAGALYVSEVTTSLTPPIAAAPQTHGITVKRQFRLAVDNPALSTAVPSGSGIDVVLDIDADTDYRYVKLEDHIPAGFEVTSGDADDNALPGSAGNGGFPIDFSDGSVGYTRQQTRDDRVEFDFDSLPKGHTQLTYHLSAETPGLYNILDAEAALTYQPEVRGSTILAQVAVGE